MLPKRSIFMILAGFSQMRHNFTLCLGKAAVLSANMEKGHVDDGTVKNIGGRR